MYQNFLLMSELTTRKAWHSLWPITSLGMLSKHLVPWRRIVGFLPRSIMFLGIFRANVNIHRLKHVWHPEVRIWFFLSSFSFVGFLTIKGLRRKRRRRVNGYKHTHILSLRTETKQRWTENYAHNKYMQYEKSAKFFFFFCGLLGLVTIDIE